MLIIESVQSYNWAPKMCKEKVWHQDFHLNPQPVYEMHKRTTAFVGYLFSKIREMGVGALGVATVTP